MTWVDLVMGRYCRPGSNIDFTSMKRLSVTKFVATTSLISTVGLNQREEGHFQSSCKHQMEIFAGCVSVSVGC